jgi:hypothetical protein
MASRVILSTQLINHNFLITPSSSVRQPHPNTEAKLKSPDEKAILHKSLDKTLYQPFPHFPLEIPKISRLIYKPVRAQYKINRISLSPKTKQTKRTSKSTIRAENPVLPQLPKRQSLKSSLATYSEEEDDANLSLKWEYSERIFWNKRKTRPFPLVIIVFEGVIGDFYKQNYWDPRTSDMVLCPGWIKGLFTIYQKAYIAVISSLSPEKAEFLSELFKYNNVSIDAMYRRKGIQPYFSQNYSQVLQEFNCSSALVLAAVGLETAEIETRANWELIFEPTLSNTKKINIQMWPLHKENSMKYTVLLIPNPRAQAEEGCLNFNRIAKVVRKVIKHLKGNMEIIEVGHREVIRVGKIEAGKFGSFADGEQKVMVYCGSHQEKKAYFRYFYSAVKSQIELNKYRKKDSM